MDTNLTPLAPSWWREDRRRVLPMTHDIGFVFRLTRVVEGLLAVSSITGLLFAQQWYDATATTYPAFIGQDIFTLVFALPLLTVSARLARAGSMRALVCWMGALFYIAYSYYFYVAGARFNPLFPAYIGIVSMSAYGALFLFFAIDLQVIRRCFVRDFPVRTIGTFLMALAVAFAALWLTMIVSSVASGRDLDAVARTVISLDGVILLPLLFYGGLWLWRREAGGYVLAGLLLVKAVATFSTLLFTTSIAAKWRQPVDPLQTAAFGASLVGAATLLAVYLRGLSDRAAAEGDIP